MAESAGKEDPKKSSMGSKVNFLLVQRLTPAGSRGRDDLVRGSLEMHSPGNPVASREAVVTRAKASVFDDSRGLKVRAEPGESPPEMGVPAAQTLGGVFSPKRRRVESVELDSSLTL